MDYKKLVLEIFPNTFAYKHWSDYFSIYYEKIFNEDINLINPRFYPYCLSYSFISEYDAWKEAYLQANEMIIKKLSS